MLREAWGDASDIVSANQPAQWEYLSVADRMSSPSYIHYK
jgi:hypothetical protein